MSTISSQTQPSPTMALPGATTNGPAKKMPSKVSPPCAKRIRSDLFQKLGIVDERSQQASMLMRPQLNRVSSDPVHQKMTMAGPATPTTEKTILGPNIKVVKAPLKKDEGPDPLAKVAQQQQSFLVTLGSFFRVGSPPALQSASSSSSSAMTAASSAASESQTDDSSTICSSASRRSLTFDEEVSVVHIPRREQYSNRIRQHLWFPSEVLQANVARNTIEYAADGWKWQDVREEQDHVVCRESGELIHPVHEEIARMIREEQGLPADVPVWTPFLNQAPIGGTGRAA